MRVPLLLASVQLGVLEFLPLETPKFFRSNVFLCDVTKFFLFYRGDVTDLSIVLVSATSRDVTVAIQLFLFEDCCDVT